MTTTRELAVLGGHPAFGEELHVGRPNVGSTTEFLRLTAEMLERRWLTNNGPVVLELERRLAGRMGVKHCIAMCNGTIALEIALRAAGVTGEVIVPAYTFVATAHALQWQEITPVFCDVDPVTHTLDPGRVEALITPRTTAILAVHLWGRACDVEALQEIADRRGLKLMYDAAHAFGVSHHGTPVGGFGDAEVFSFHATKFYNSFEGGAVTTNDDGLANTMRLMRNFGFSGLDQVSHVGTNGKMTEICAAMGLVNLDAISTFVSVNRSHAKRYASGLASVPGLRLFDPEPGSGDSNYQYVVVEVDEALAGLSRDQIVEALWVERVRARRYFYPGVHRMEPYRSYFPHAGLLLPVTEQLCETVMVLPTGTGLTSEDVDTVCSIIRNLVEAAPAVRDALEARAS